MGMTVNTASTRLSAAAEEFIESVLALRPRLGVFDCDGTLWQADSGERFFSWELERGLVTPEVVRWARDRYEQYRRGQVSEEIMCGEMVAMHKGLRLATLESAAEEFFPQCIAPGIYPEMLALTRRLVENDCDVWAISSTNDWVVRAGVRRFGIAPDHVIACGVEFNDGCATGRLIRVPSGEGKAVAIRDIIGNDPDVAFGNSVWDIAMLKMARHAFAINPTSELSTAAQQEGWTTYYPGGKSVI